MLPMVSPTHFGKIWGQIPISPHPHQLRIHATARSATECHPRRRIQRPRVRQGEQQQADEPAHQRAVDADVLQVEAEVQLQQLRHLACVPALYGAFDVLGEKFGHLGHPLEEIGIRLQISTGIPYNRRMRTVIETPTFQKQAAKLWTEGERLEFIDWIAENPLAGDVIPGAEGARKVRWSRRGSGRSGGDARDLFQLDRAGSRAAGGGVCQSRPSQHACGRNQKRGMT